MSRYFKSFTVLFLSRWSCQSFLSSVYVRGEEGKKKKKKVDKQEKGIKPLTGCRAAAATATAAAAFILALGYILSSEALEEVMLLPPVTTKSCQE